MKSVTVTQSKTTLAMIMCGIVGAAYVGAAAAATPDQETPSVAVHYDAKDMSTQDGALNLYRKLVMAAAEVCPANSASPYFISQAVRECREQSIARAVFKVNNPTLVAVFNTRNKNG